MKNIYLKIGFNYLFVSDVLIVDEDVAEWLKQNDSPRELVVEKWTESFPYREKCVDVFAYFALYKCLQTTFAHTLVLY